MVGCVGVSGCVCVFVYRCMYVCMCVYGQIKDNDIIVAEDAFATSITSVGLYRCASSERGWCCHFKPQLVIILKFSRDTSVMISGKIIVTNATLALRCLP